MCPEYSVRRSCFQMLSIPNGLTLACQWPLALHGCADKAVNVWKHCSSGSKVQSRCEMLQQQCRSWWELMLWVWPASLPDPAFLHSLSPTFTFLRNQLFLQFRSLWHMTRCACSADGWIDVGLWCYKCTDGWKGRIWSVETYRVSYIANDLFVLRILQCF